MLKLENVSKFYYNKGIIASGFTKVNLELKIGEFVAITGESGSGKSTLLHLIGGVDIPSSGEVIIDGQRVDKYSEKELTHYRREDIGFVFQFYNLVQNLTALENVELATQICKNPLDPKRTIEKVGLKNRKDNFPS